MISWLLLVMWTGCIVTVLVIVMWFQVILLEKRKKEKKKNKIYFQINWYQI